MNTMEKQIEILNKLANIMIESYNYKYHKLVCNFELDLEDESVGQEFYSVYDGRRSNLLLDDPDWIVSDLIFDLQNEMYLHTGGRWNAFTLTILQNGESSTDFKYG
ncbi:hypothetical protein D0Y50_10515 [Salinimonas sediminis]|uniref:DUF600 family protein n=2 Tax=Salinimonas sediminis TaxID=2303538 RepID=A0A346NMK1_9ALTE|nr:hypothetical protein D0Y50_10515 [Salinimonas sediminis]